MFEKPNPKPDFSKIDVEINEWWKQNNTFQKSIDIREDSEKYVFYDGPPFITGIPHYGSILSSVSKDVIPRYQTMKGKLVERVWGWDAHGLPIEEKVEKQMGLSGRKEILENFEEFINQCYEWNRVGYENWTWYVEKVGRWVDLENAYRTMDQDYMESVWWVFKQMWDKGLVYRGKRTSLFSTDSSTPVSNFEVSMDSDNYQDTEDIAVTVKFQLDQPSTKKLGLSEKTFLVAWTTTPWTLPSNFALAVNPEATYAALKIDDETIIIAKDLIESVIREEFEYEIVSELTASELEGLNYIPLFNYFAGGENDFKVYLSEYVTIEDGTGVLHVAPAFGEADFEMGKEFNLSFDTDIDDAGKMLVGEWTGQYLRDASPKIADQLEQEGKLLRQEKYIHRLPYYRYDNPLIYMAQDNYFVDVQNIKDTLIENNEKINWVPEHFGEGRFKHILETAPDWSISRDRFWGTVMPLWESGDGEQIVVGSRDGLKDLVNSSDDGNLIQKITLELHPDCDLSSTECLQDLQSQIDSGEEEIVYRTTQEILSEIRHKFLGETEAESKVKPISANQPRSYYLINKSPLDMHRPFIDAISFIKEGKRFTRVSQTLDVWMDSGSMPFAQFHYPFTQKEEFEQSFPGDFISEYTGQIRAWFYVLHVISNAVFEKNAFKNVLVNGVLAGTDGRKMSKSYGNYPDPKQTLEKYGGDALRLYLLGSTLMSGNDTNFSEEQLKMQTREYLIPLWNIYKYLITYANIHNWQPESMDSNYLLSDLSNELDKWAVSVVNKAILEVDEHLGGYNTPKAIDSFLEAINQISKWYIRRSRDRFGKGDESTLKVLFYSVLKITEIAAPIIPFTSEKIYRGLVSNNSIEPESIHLRDFPTRFEVDGNEAELLTQMEVVRAIAELGQSIRTTSGIKVRQPLQTLFVSSSDLNLEDWMKDLLKDELNLKEVVETKAIPSDSGISQNSDSRSNILIGLDTNLTEELALEGTTREIIRAIQSLRKELGFDVMDTINISYSTDSDQIKSAIVQYESEITDSVGANSITQDEAEHEKKINQETIRLSLEKI